MTIPVGKAGPSWQRGDSIRIAPIVAPRLELYVETGSVRRIQNSCPEGMILQSGSCALPVAQKKRASIKTRIVWMGRVAAWRCGKEFATSWGRGRVVSGCRIIE